jgi:hypothetical protein
MTEIEIFTSKGGLRPASDFSEMELNGMSAERKERFNALRQAAFECETAEADLAAAQDSVVTCARAVEAARAELDKVKPTPHQLWVQTFHPERLR